MASMDAEHFKTKGNECYTAKDYWKAIDWYSKAISTLPTPLNDEKSESL